MNCNDGSISEEIQFVFCGFDIHPTMIPKIYILLQNGSRRAVKGGTNLHIANYCLVMKTNLPFIFNSIMIKVHRRVV